MLNSLSLTNFKRHLALDVKFAPGLNLITGANYQGKTTLLKGVLFALGGVSYAGGKSKVTTRGAKGGTRVELVITGKGRRFRIERTPSTGKVFDDELGDLLASGNTETTRYIEERVLGMPLKRWVRTQLSKQGETAALLTLGVTELHKLVEEAGGVATVNRALFRLKERSDALNGALAALPQQDVAALEGALGNSEALLAREYEEASKLEATAGGAADIAQHHAEKLRQAEQSNRERAAELTARGDLERALGRQRTALEDVTQRLGQAVPPTRLGEPVHPLSDEAYAELTGRVGAARQAHLTARETAASRVHAQQAVDRHAASLGKAEVALAAALVALAEQEEPRILAPVTEAKEKAYGARTAAAADVARLEKAAKDGVCGACGRPFDPSHDQKHAELELEACRSALRAADEGLARLIEQERGLKAVHQAYDRAKDRVEQEKASVLLFQREVDAATAALAKLPEADVASAAQLETSLAAQLQVAGEIRRAVETLKQEKARVQGEIDRLTHDLACRPAAPEEIDLEPLRAKAQSSAAAAAEAKATADKAGADYLAHYRQVQDAAARLAVAREQQKQRDETARRLGAVTSLTKYLRENRDSFIADTWAGITGYASSIASAATDGTIQMVGRDDAEFFFMEDGDKMPVEEASGAQSSIMGMGVQMAISRMMPVQEDCMLFDEPTAAMDEQRSLMMATLAAADGRQVIMVSHREMDSAVAANVIRLGE